jgi:hypothetical protein
VKLTQFDMMRVWAMVTGLILCAFFFGAHYLGFQTSETMPMLIAGVAGFELFHFVQDLVLRRRRDA